MQKQSAASQSPVNSLFLVSADGMLTARRDGGSVQTSPRPDSSHPQLPRPRWLMHSIGCPTLRLRALRRKAQYWFHREGGSVIGTWMQRASASAQLVTSLTTRACLSYGLRGGPSRLPLFHGLIGLGLARAWPVLLPPCPILGEALLRVARIIELDRPGGCLGLDQRAEPPAAYALAGGIHAVHSRLTSRSQGSPGTCPRRPWPGPPRPRSPETWPSRPRRTAPSPCRDASGDIRG